MKLRKRELGYFVVLIILTLLFKQTVFNTLVAKLGLSVQANPEYLKLAGVFLNVTIGYIGLVKHEVKWTKIAWLAIYGILILLIITDQVTEGMFRYSLVDFDYSLFVSPVFYLAACLLPRYVNLDNVNLNHQKAK